MFLLTQEVTHNAQLSDNNRQIELLTEQISLMNQRFFGRKSEAAVSDIDGKYTNTMANWGIKSTDVYLFLIYDL